MFSVKRRLANYFGINTVSIRKSTGKNKFLLAVGQEEKNIHNIDKPSKFLLTINLSQIDI